jgi:imidazolonepropionase-like amidohydrolase
MVGAGMTPVQATRTATTGNADLLGLAHEIGTLAPFFSWTGFSPS